MGISGRAGLWSLTSVTISAGLRKSGWLHNAPSPTRHASGMRSLHSNSRHALPKPGASTPPRRESVNGRALIPAHRSFLPSRKRTAPFPR
jgi:hypothetical protein